MSSDVTTKNSELGAVPAQAFNTGGLSYRVLAWVYFCSSLKQPGWQQKAASLQVGKVAINQWLAQGAIASKARAVSFLLLLLGGLLGVATMVGALSYSGEAPVNLWLILGLFSVLPLLMTLSSTFTALRLSAEHPPFLIELFARATQRVSTGINASQLLRSGAGRLWLFRQVQWFGVVFQLALIISFMLVLLFNDIAFGWSSTLIQQAHWLPNFLNIFTWPWQWLVDAPSGLLIEQSQYYRASSNLVATANPALLGQWWPHIAMAMIVYGLIPRCLLVIWLSYKARCVLVREIHNSCELDNFFQVCTKTSTIKPKVPPIPTQATDDEIILPVLTLNAEWLVIWQREFSSAPSTILGLKKWQDDEQWLKDNAQHWQGTTYLLVQEQQVPTAELADIIALVSELNSQCVIELVVQVNIMEKPDSERQIHQLKSWRYFATEQSINIIFTRAIERQSNNTVDTAAQGNCDAE